jgi:hypothetical protein
MSAACADLPVAVTTIMDAAELRSRSFVFGPMNAPYAQVLVTLAYHLYKEYMLW